MRKQGYRARGFGVRDARRPLGSGPYGILVLSSDPIGPAWLPCPHLLRTTLRSRSSDRSLETQTFGTALCLVFEKRYSRST